MSKSEEVEIEEEFVEEAAGKEESEDKDWSEEFKVASDELVDTVKKLIREAGVRRIVIKTKDDRVLLEIPVVVGLAGIIILPSVLSVLALIAAMVTETSILVEKRVEEEQAEDETAD
jgi:hypothetical protein